MSLVLKYSWMFITQPTADNLVGVAYSIRSAARHIDVLTATSLHAQSIEEEVDIDLGIDRCRKELAEQETLYDLLRILVPLNSHEYQEWCFSQGLPTPYKEAGKVDTYQEAGATMAPDAPAVSRDREAQGRSALSADEMFNDGLGGGMRSTISGRIPANEEAIKRRQETAAKLAAMRTNRQQ